MSHGGSPVWDDVMRVWLDPHGVVEAVRQEGRHRGDWWQAVALYSLALGFGLVMHYRLGADKLFDRLLDSLLGPADSTINPGVVGAFWVAALLSLVTLYLVQWLILPLASRIMGGRAARGDASRAMYLLVCVGFFLGFISVTSDLVAVLLSAFWPGAGGHLVLAGTLGVICLGMHQATRLAAAALELPSYPRGVAVLMLSLLPGLVAAALVFALAMIGSLVLFPEMLE